MAAEQQIQVKASDEDLKGRYANVLQVGHTQDEFFFDFFLLAPPAGQLVSRIATSPGHTKRILQTLSQQVSEYEKKFGRIDQAEDPGRIGFQA